MPVPPAALLELGQRLELAIEPDWVLPTLVHAIAQGLQLPYVAFWIRRPDTDADELVTEFGDVELPNLHTQQLPVRYQDELIGHLRVSQHAAAPEMDAATLALLQRLARQAGPAAHMVQLTNDLRRTRERLVLTREEERRHLRHEMHDSIGPTIAALDLRFSLLKRQIDRDPAAANIAVDELRKQLRGVILQIRQVIYDLRPPALDELGLLPAIREQARQLAIEGLSIGVDAPDALPGLNTAAEVAIYRIVSESLTNVLRHAGATRAWLSLQPTPNTIVLDVSDDGKGIDPARRMGVGLTSMRERVSELGGKFSIGPREGGGTRLRASIPYDPSLV